jgi:hypothetical protein
MTMKKLVPAMMALALLAGLQAPAAFAAAGSNTGRILTLLWYDGHAGLLIRQEGMSDLGGCGRSDYFIVDNAHMYYKEIYAMLLSAYMADQAVTLNLENCHQGISRVRHVTLTR